jgi:carbon monoxide dehydrogenase subunit G
VARVEESIEIQRPPEDVYDFMADVNNLTQCSDAVTEVRDAPDRAVEEGDTYTTVARVFGRTVETLHRVIDADPPHRLEMDGKNGSMHLRVVITFEPSGEGTRVTQIGEGEPGGALRFAGPMVERTIRQQIRNDLKNLKKLLEHLE